MSDIGMEDVLTPSVADISGGSLVPSGKGFRILLALGLYGLLVFVVYAKSAQERAASRHAAVSSKLNHLGDSLYELRAGVPLVPRYVDVPAKLVTTAIPVVAETVDES